MIYFKYMIINFIVSTLLIFVLAQVIPGVTVSSIYTAATAALLLSIVNITIKPLLQLFTLPLTFISFGLFTFILDALLILFLANVLKGFTIEGFVTALVFSISLGFLNALINVFRK